MDHITTNEALEAFLIRVGVDDEVASQFVAHASPPPESSEKGAVEAIVAKRGHRGVKEVRNVSLKNWMVNWPQLLFDAGVALGGAAASGTNPYYRVLLLLACLRSMAKAAIRDLGESEAKLVVLIYESPGDVVDKSLLKNASGLNSKVFEASIDVLLDVGAIALEEDERIFKTSSIIYI